nr:hypothetical protein [Tanacetum cinerariifolium]
VGPGCLAAPAAELSPISSPGVVRQAFFRGGMSASGISILGEVDESKALILIPAALYPSGAPVSVGLVVRGDPGACIGSSGSNASASLAERAISTVGRGWSSKGASSSDGAKYSGYSGSGT